jgi:hypothetical protein
MKFDSKAHMVRELLAGKKFKDRTRNNGILYYDERLINPFQYGKEPAFGIWQMYDKDIWEEVEPTNTPVINGSFDLCQHTVIEEVKPRHVHQDLIDSYQEGQIWQYRYNTNTDWLDATYYSMHWKPDWDESMYYRLHPHNDLIQEFNKGASIQAFIRGEWIDTTSPSWNEDIQYRIKPNHTHQDLIDSYKEGQLWQYRYNDDMDWLNVTHCLIPCEPAWKEDTQYRLHPHNELIQAYRNGVKIQVYSHGSWVDIELEPYWHESSKYRVKPAVKIVYEWLYKTNFSNDWEISPVLKSEEEAKDFFDRCKYKKTDRSWEVEE